MAYNYLFKLLIIGDPEVGKTSICSRLSNNKFSNLYDETIGVEFSTCFTHIYNSLLIKCQLWDTSGRKSFLPVIDTYYKGVAGIIIVYDVSNRKSFEKLDFWLNEVKKNKRQDEDINILVLGNKVDKHNREVTWKEANDKCIKNNCIFFETSAKLNENVDEIKKAFCRTIYDNYNHDKGHSGIKLPVKFSLEDSPNQNDFDCCCCF
tara:strand:- start:328 stop:945 length:618 start_codon:yes stop_codon:yes gene_type:complete